jgi:hypothetical protein
MLVGNVNAEVGGTITRSIKPMPIAICEMPRVSLRELAEEKGYTVKWDNETKSVVLNSENDEIIVNVVKDEDAIILNGRVTVSSNFFYKKAEEKIELPVVIGEIKEYKDGRFLIENYPGGIILGVNKDTEFVDITKDELKNGVRVKVSYGPMVTKSIPAQSGIKRIERVLDKPIKEGEVTEVEENKLVIGTYPDAIVFNILEETIIVNPNGEVVKFEDIKIGASIYVEHSNVMTMSLPPITNAYKIIVK